MPRDIPLGNGKLLITFDRYYRIRDIYYPHVGKENQTVGHPSRFGVWVDGQLSWLGPDWKISLRYEDGTMVTRVEAHHPGLQVTLLCADAVDFNDPVYVRKIIVRKLGRHGPVFFQGLRIVPRFEKALGFLKMLGRSRRALKGCEPGTTRDQQKEHKKRRPNPREPPRSNESNGPPIASQTVLR